MVWSEAPTTGESSYSPSPIATAPLLDSTTADSVPMRHTDVADEIETRSSPFCGAQFTEYLPFMACVGSDSETCFVLFDAMGGHEAVLIGTRTQ